MRERLFFYILDNLRVAIMAPDDDAAYLQLREFSANIEYRAETVKILDIPRNVCPVCENHTMEDNPCPENRPGCLVYHGCHCTYCGHSPQIIAGSNIIVPNEWNGFRLFDRREYGDLTPKQGSLPQVRSGVRKEDQS